MNFKATLEGIYTVSFEAKDLPQLVRFVRTNEEIRQEEIRKAQQQVAEAERIIQEQPPATPNDQ